MLHHRSDSPSPAVHMDISPADQQSAPLAAHLTSPTADDMTTPPDAHISSLPTDLQAAPSSGCDENPQTSLGFNPEHVQPLPKAGPRKTPSTGRKRKQTAILTDTPVKMALEADQRSRKISFPMKRLCQKQGKSTPTNLKQSKLSTSRKKNQKMNNTEQDNTDSSDADENFCIVCMENFNNSKPKEAWVKCLTCALWAHEACTPGQPYICHHCDSDGD